MQRPWLFHTRSFLSAALFFLVSFPHQKEDHSGKNKETKHNTSPEFTFLDRCIDLCDFASYLTDFGLHVGSLRSYTFNVDTMEDAVKTVALVEKAVFHLIDRETETVESFKITFCGSNHRIRFNQRQADQSGPLIRMTLRTSFFIDQVEICPLNLVIAMTDDALRRASFKGLSMSAPFVGIGNAHMATATEIWDICVLRSANETFVGAHCHSIIGGIATMTVVTGDA